MTKDILKIQKRFNDIDYDKFANVLVGTVYGTDFNTGFDGYEAAKSLINLIASAESAHEYDTINKTVIALLGWSIETLLEETEEAEQ